MSRRYAYTATLTAVTALSLLLTVPLAAQAAFGEPTTPYYYKVDVLMDFPSLDYAEISIRQSLYGDLAVSLKQAIEAVGEEVYLDSVSAIIKAEIGNRSLITGKYDFVLDGDPQVQVRYSGAELPRAEILIDFALRGSESTSETKVLMYLMDASHPWLYQLYTQPILVRFGNTSVVVPMHELNLTILLPPGFCVETGGPRASAVKLLGEYPNQRVVLNWHVTNPSVETRGTTVKSFGPLFFILDRPNEEAFSKIQELESSLPTDGRAEELLNDLSRAKSTLLEFCSVNQTYLADLEARVPQVSGGTGPSLVVWAASLGVTAVLIAASAMLLRRR